MHTTPTIIAKAIAIAALLTAGAASAQQGLVTERSITVNAAIELATVSLERCRADGYKVSITVLNRHARTAVVLSEDGVNPHTIENGCVPPFTQTSGTILRFYH